MAKLKAGNTVPQPAAAPAPPVPQAQPVVQQAVPQPPAAPPPAPAPQAPVAQSPSASTVPQTTAHPAAPAPAVAQAPARMPFSVSQPGEMAQAATGGGGRPNLVQKRQEKIQAAIQAGAPFAFKERRDGQPFNCICGAEGKNAIVLTDKNGQEVLVGSNCLRYTGVEVPKQPRQARTATAPGVSKQQKFAETLGKYTAPFRFVRKQEGPFTCLCGGRGTNQIIVADANGAEFAVGNTCAAVIPGVEIPKPQRQAAPGAPAVAGLKGGVQAPPTFTNVT